MYLKDLKVVPGRFWLGIEDGIHSACLGMVLS